MAVTNAASMTIAEMREFASFTAAEQLETIDAYFSDYHRESYDLAC